MALRYWGGKRPSGKGTTIMNSEKEWPERIQRCRRCGNRGMGSLVVLVAATLCIVDNPFTALVMLLILG